MLSADLAAARDAKSAAAVPGPGGMPGDPGPEATEYPFGAVWDGAGGGRAMGTVSLAGDCRLTVVSTFATPYPAWLEDAVGAANSMESLGPLYAGEPDNPVPRRDPAFLGRLRGHLARTRDMRLI